MKCFLSIKTRLLMISALVTFSPDSKYSDGIMGCPSDNCLCCLIVVTALADAGTSAFSTDKGAFSTDTGAFSTDTGAFSTDTGVFSTNTGAFSTDTGELSTNTGASALLDDAELPGFDDDNAELFGIAKLVDNDDAELFGIAELVVVIADGFLKRVVCLEYCFCYMSIPA